MSTSLIIFLLCIIGVYSECRDLVPCERAVPYCHLPHLIKTMALNCPSTCGFCSSPNDDNPKNNEGGNRPLPPINNGDVNQVVTKTPVEPAPIFKYPAYTLHYFNVRFRAEPIRMMFHYKNIPFNDVRVKRSEWNEKKSTYIDEELPMLEIDNQKLSQSMSIYRYLARKIGLFGSDEIETAKLDYISELWRQFIDQTLVYKRVAVKVEAGDQANLHDNVFMPAIKKYGTRMEALLDESGTGYFGRSISWVDFYVAGTVQSFSYIDPETMLGFTKLTEHNERIYKLPQLQAYLKDYPPVSIL